MRKQLAVFIAVLLAVFASGIARAVAVSPIALYIDSRERSGLLTLYNDGTRPEEVQLDFAFGYPVSDSTGHITVDLQPTAPAGEPSALGMATAFPRRMILQPGQRQVVRVLIEPPAGLADGEYWARVLVKSKGGRPPIEQKREDGVNLQLDIETTIAIPMAYRHGSVKTGVGVTAADAETVGDSVVATIDLARSGNAAYLGRVRAELVDAGGRVLATREENLGVYRNLRRVYKFGGAAIAGDLRVRFTLNSNRDDLPEKGPLPAADVTHTTAVRR